MANIPHSSNTILRLLRYVIFVMTAIVVSGCEDCCCDCDDDCTNGPAVWYRTEIQASYDNEWFIPVTPRTDWNTRWPDSLGISRESLTHPLPSGLRVVTFTSDGSSNDHNLDTFGGEVPMTSLTNRILVYNNDTEYIVFDHPDSYSDCTASTRRRNAGYYSGNSKVGSDVATEPVRSQPDMLFRAALAESTVDSLMTSTAENPTEKHTISVTLVPAVYVYVVHFTFSKGIDYVLNASAAMTGLSSGVNMSSGRTLAETCTLMFDCKKVSDGLTGTMMSFGAPDYATDDEHYTPSGRYGITLQVLLTNGKRKAFTMDVTPQMAVQPSGGIVMIGNLEVSEDDAQPDGGGSFDVDVDPWGAPNDYEIIL